MRGMPKAAEKKDLYVRGIPPETQDAMRAAALGRGLSMAEYLIALYELHQLVKEPGSLANVGRIRRFVEEHNLQTVKV